MYEPRQNLKSALLVAATAAAVACSLGLATPAAATIELTLDSQPAIELLSFQFDTLTNPPRPVIDVHGLIDSSTPSLFQDVATGRVFQEATLTTPTTLFSFDQFVGISLTENITAMPPTFTAEFAYGQLTVQQLPPAVPEPSTWAMLLLGFLGLGFAFRQSRRKVLVA